ncbi:DUF2971 domain-containing protein [Methylobacterium sp. EM32]|uniref:DUF2971 domain-containing protein n=1 Tax=Methylobacterium sp. EM32 TaxID=3163481 RepID=UPI0033BDF91A
MVWNIIRKMFDKTFDKEECIKTLENSLLSRPIPGKVYRYTKLSENLINTIREQRFYMPTFSELNDPCEGFYNVKMTVTDDALKSMFRHMRAYSISKETKDELIKIHGVEIVAMLEELKNLPESDFIQACRMMSNQIENQTEDFRQSQRQIDLKNITVLSFSESASSPLMCYNYADNNKGVCLEFATTSGPLRALSKVKYRDIPPTLDTSTIIQTSEESRMLTKHTDWSNEQEWRYIGHIDNGKYTPFNIKYSLSITFCTRADVDMGKKLLHALNDAGWNSNGGENIFRFHADTSRKTYGLIKIKENYIKI